MATVLHVAEVRNMMAWWEGGKVLVNEITKAMTVDLVRGTPQVDPNIGIGILLNPIHH